MALKDTKVQIKQDCKTLKHHIQLYLKPSGNLLNFVSTIVSDPIFWQIKVMILQGYLQDYLEFLLSLGFRRLSISQYHQSQTEIILFSSAFLSALHEDGLQINENNLIFSPIMSSQSCPSETNTSFFWSQNLTFLPQRNLP